MVFCLLCCCISPPPQPIAVPFNYGWVVLFAGFCMHLCIGTVYCWGNMTTYATSYLRLTDPNLTYGDTLWVFMSGGLLQAVSMFPGGRLQLRIGQRLTALLGSTLVVGAYLFGSLATTLAPFLLCYGALFGLGTGLVYTCPTTAAVQWLPHRKGLVNGVVVMGFGLGAFCFNFFITAWCNPDHLPEDVVGPDGGRYYSEHSGVPGRVPGLLRTMAAAFAVVLALGSLLIRPPPQTAPAPLLGDDGAPATPAAAPPAPGLDAGPSKPPVAQRAAAANADTSCSPGGSLQPAAAADGGDSIGEVPTSRVARSALGWSLLSGFFCTGMGGAYVISTYKTFGEQQASGHVTLSYLATHLHTSPHLTPRLTLALISYRRRGTPTSTSRSSDR